MKHPRRCREDAVSPREFQFRVPASARERRRALAREYASAPLPEPARNWKPQASQLHLRELVRLLQLERERVRAQAAARPAEPPRPSELLPRKAEALKESEKSSRRA